MMWLKNSLLLLSLCFLCVHAVERDDDISGREVPPAKKRRRLSPTKVWHRRDLRGKKLLTIIQEHSEEGCHYKRLQSVMPKSQHNARAVLEAVVNMMFTQNMDVSYDYRTEKYTFMGPAPTAPPTGELSTALSALLTGPSEGFACRERGILGYNLFKRGFRLTDSWDFTTIHSAVRILCDVQLPQKLSFMKKILDFAEHCPEGHKGFPKAVDLYCVQNDKKISLADREVLHYLLTLNKESQEKIVKSSQRQVCADGGGACVGMPVAMKRRFEASKKVKRQYKRRGLRNKEILDILKEHPDGCHYTKFKPVMVKERTGANAVLESVVNVMFTKNIDVDYNHETQTYTLLGPAPTITPPVHLSVALAKIFAGPYRDFSCDGLGRLGYSFFKEGYRVKNYWCFVHAHNSVRILCGFQLTDRLSSVQTILTFVEEHCPEDQKGFPDAVDFYCETTKTTVCKSERTLLRYILDLDQKYREEIAEIRRKMINHES